MAGKLMKKIIFILLLLTIGLFAQTRRYVDGEIGTSGNGQTWGTAWKTFDDIVWSQLRGGGYLYISGGNDSVVYNQTLSVGTYGTSTNRLYIMAGKYSPSPASEDKRVVIRDATGPGIEIDVCDPNRYIDWIYIKGIEIQHAGAEGVNLHCDVNNIVLDSLWIENCEGQGIFVNGNDDWSGLDTSYTADNIEIKNCTIISQVANTGVDDNIAAQKNHNLVIHHNFLHQRNQQTGDGTGDHIDNIQTMNASSDLKIYNNICIVDSGVRGHAFILGQFAKTANYSDTVFVYNNFIRNGGHIVGTCYYQQVLFFRLSENFGAQPYIPLCYSVNNTVIVANRGTQNVVDGNPSYTSNTIILQYGTNGGTPPGDCALGMIAAENEDVQNGITGAKFYKYVDSCHTNLFWRTYSPNNVAFDGDMWRWGSTTGSIDDWSDWVNKGGDGVNSDPLMLYHFNHDGFNKTPWNTDIVKIESNSPAIDAGTNMSYLIEGKFGYLPDISTNDILGNPRDANWDIGAFEYIENSQLKICGITGISKILGLSNISKINGKTVTPEGQYTSDGVNDWYFSTVSSGTASANSWTNKKALTRGATHTGTSNKATVLTDASASFITNEWVGNTIINMTSMASGTVTSNTGTTITCSAGLSGGTPDDDWDNGDIYLIQVTNWPSIIAGDTVWVDGGTLETDSLIYKCFEYTISLSGNSGNYIKITNSKDIGHLGRAVFLTDYTVSPQTIRSIDVTGDGVELSYLKFMSTNSSNSGYEVIDIGGDYQTYKYLNIFNPHSKAIRIGYANAQSHDIKILNCNTDTGINSNNSECDGIFIQDPGGRDVEIAYNKIYIRNTNSSSIAHKDCIQTAGWQTGGSGSAFGTSSIHHNFFWNASSTTTLNTVLELGAIGGHWNLYNNILVYGGVGSGRILGSGNCPGENWEGNKTMNIYNNTFVIVDPNYYGVRIEQSQTLNFKNNIIINPGAFYNEIIPGLTTVIPYLSANAWDYNVYDVDVPDAGYNFWYSNDCDGGSSYSGTFANWQTSWSSPASKTVQDQNSTHITTGTNVSFTGGNLRSLDPLDFRLNTGSPGKGQGTSSVGGLFNDNYFGTTRTEPWNVGAY